VTWWEEVPEVNWWEVAQGVVLIWEEGNQGEEETCQEMALQWKEWEVESEVEEDLHQSIWEQEGEEAQTSKAHHSQEMTSLTCLLEDIGEEVVVEEGL
jgi:hypothetical protein